jgi:hypothetical protein
VGSAAFRFAEGLAFGPEDCILEIGSEHGEGSTAALAAAAHASKVPFYSIDVDPGVSAGIAHIPGVTPVCGAAEDVLAAWPHPERVRFAWLDGYDWPYSFYPGTAEQVAAYAARGRKITREDSQRSHLDIARLLLKHAGEDSLAAFDDTWLTPAHAWSGKGGTAVPFLLAEGWEIEAHSPPMPEPDDGWVILRDRRVRHDGT